MTRPRTMLPGLECPERVGPNVEPGTAKAKNLACRSGARTAGFALDGAEKVEYPGHRK